MNEIKPIETWYKGIKFRSRLEARWAVFFDACGIKYEYEPGGFERKWGEDEVYKYLPDFYLPEYDIYVEVKPTDERLFKDADKLGMMVDFGGPMSNGLLILGNIPDPTKMTFANIPIFSLLYNKKAVRLEHAAFIPHSYRGVVFARGDRLLQAIYCDFGLEGFYDCLDGGGIPEKTTTQCRWSKENVRSVVHPATKEFQLLKTAYIKARSARFEHGENGAIV